MKRIGLLLPFIGIVMLSAAQQLTPGFDKLEYANLMKVSAQMGDSTYRAGVPVPAGYVMQYRSPVMGLDNLWELWMTDS